jgi:hypothetical protein
MFGGTLNKKFQTPSYSIAWSLEFLVLEFSIFGI